MTATTAPLPSWKVVGFVEALHDLDELFLRGFSQEEAGGISEPLVGQGLRCEFLGKRNERIFRESFLVIRLERFPSMICHTINVRGTCLVDYATSGRDKEEQKDTVCILLDGRCGDIGHEGGQTR